jgi:uncharacterized protein YdaU (DUF1376 family)
MPFEMPYFPLYPADFLGDEKARLMDNRQFGIYCKLLFHEWIEGSIPADPQKLARIVGEESQAFLEIWPGISQAFSTESQAFGRLANRRIEDIRKSLIERHKAFSEAGKLGGRPRKINKLQSKKGGFPTEKPGFPTEKPGLSTRARGRSLSLEKYLVKLNNKEKALKFSETWDLWEKHRKEKRNALTPTTIEKQLAFLEKQPDPIAVINQSIEKGWTGLFELKTNGHQEGKTPAGGVRGEAGKYDERMAAARRESEL